MDKSRDRQIFNSLKKSTGRVPAPAQLRQKIELKNNKTTYAFDLKPEPKGGDIPLRDSDLFVGTKVGFFLMREATAKAGTGELQTYVNSTYFTAVAGFTPSDLETVYNGHVDISIDRTKLYEFFPMSRFNVTPQTQQSATIGKSQRNPKDGYAEVDPLLFFYGRNANEFKVEIPSVTGIQIESVTAGFVHYLVLVTDGFLLQGYANGSQIAELQAKF